MEGWGVRSFILWCVLEFDCVFNEDSGFFIVVKCLVFDKWFDEIFENRGCYFCGRVVYFGSVMCIFIVIKIIY